MYVYSKGQEEVLKLTWHYESADEKNQHQRARVWEMESAQGG